MVTAWYFLGYFLVNVVSPFGFLLLGSLFFLIGHIWYILQDRTVLWKEGSIFLVLEVICGPLIHILG